jgi:hypothetical protein
VGGFAPPPACALWKLLRPADVEDDAVITALRLPESGWRDRGVRLSRGRDREAPTRAPTAARHYTPKTLAAAEPVKSNETVGAGI